MKILCYSEFACSTGFAKVAEHIVEGVAASTPKSWHFDVIGVNYYGEKMEYSDKVTVHSFMEKAIDKKDIYGRDSILRFVKENGPYDVLFILHDLSVIAPVYPHLKLLKRQCHAAGNKIKYVLYFPIDSPPHPWHIVAGDIFNPGEKAGLEIFDELITYTKYGKDQVMEVVKRYSLVNYLKMKERIHVMPHGTDPDIHYIEDRQKVADFRREYFHVGPDTFLIGQVNRNSVRKDVPTSLQAYKMFLSQIGQKEPEAVKYYMHMNATDPFGYNLYSICGALNLPGSSFITTDPAFNENLGVTKEALNLIYNSLDLFFTTTTAEGWGLTILEAMACNVPVVAPLHTSIREITENGRCLSQPTGSQSEVFFTRDGEYIRYRSNPEETSEHLYMAFITPKPERERQIDVARKHATSYLWDEICAKWASLFRTMALKHEGSMRIMR